MWEGQQMRRGKDFREMVVFVILPTVPFISRKSLERPKRSKSKKSRSLSLLCYR